LKETVAALNAKLDRLRAVEAQTRPAVKTPA